MRLRLFVVHGSHPCATVERALAIKGLSYRVVEWPPPMHAPLQRLIFGARTVPGLTIDGERISGSRAIVHRLEELVPQPALLPADPERRARVEDAERWGDEVLQPVARELLWVGFAHRPDAMPSYGTHSRLRTPAGVVRLLAPFATRVEMRLNNTDDGVAERTLAGLPGQLDEIDAWIEDGTIGDPEHPNAADLQIAPTVRLLMTMGDVRPLIEGRPCGELALRLFPDVDGDLPAGALPVRDLQSA
ncbi:MAG: glutathione S-transferase N-terminal domain-containing protein [Acidobacteriota bacterium]|nr:glutathione S-transferase N-terminal domain-containing protein [Acidobacteriota bacterium]